MQTPFFYISNPNIFLSVLLLKLHFFIPDKIYLKWMFRLNVGYKLDLNNPRSFNEKLQWLKLYDRKKIYTKLVDKYEVKKYVAQLIGEEYIIPTLGVWENVDLIDWDSLPKQFVLKTTHGSGGTSVVICKDKESFDRDSAIKLLNHSMKYSDTWAHYKEWPYKGVKRKIIAEQFLTIDGSVPEDYKIHNFNGEPKFILVCRNRFGGIGMSDDFYNVEWEHMDLSRPGKPHSGGVSKPQNLPLMLELSKKLSQNIPFVRTDFYSIGDKVYFGEMTFYPASGMVPFVPENMDYVIGEWLHLPLYEDDDQK